MKNTYSEQKSSLFNFPTAYSSEKTMREAFGDNSSNVCPSSKIPSDESMQQAEERRVNDRLWDNFRRCARS